MAGGRPVADAQRGAPQVRQPPLLAIDSLDVEEAVLQAGFCRIAGVDEVGRGSWAGPVYVAAVILPLECFRDRTLLADVTDSKLLAPAKRQRLAETICRLAVSAAVGWAEAPVIDQRNILEATRLAMRAALACLCGRPICPEEDGSLWGARRIAGPAVLPDYLLTDAVPLPEWPAPQRAVVRGDQRCLSIAAASIVAKVTRDAEMVRRAAGFPAYALAENKGYGTRRHLGALRLHGVSPLHRRSFAPMKYLLGVRDHVAGALPPPPPPPPAQGSARFGAAR